MFGGVSPKVQVYSAERPLDPGPEVPWLLLFSVKSATVQEVRVMLGLETLKFRDTALENSFRSHWDASSRTLLTLLSLLTLMIWAVATLNVHEHCKWSRFLCHVLEAVCVCVVLSHLCIQYQLRAYPGWRVQEVNKAYVLLADLAASMVFILLVEDLKEVPGGTHDWMYACHGWAILFLQVTTESAVHLHLLNLLAYSFVEGFLAHEFGWSAFIRGGARHLIAVILLCGALPLAINVTCEAQSRRDFLRRNRSHCPAAQQEWLCP
ncbi:hypothetical protein COCOBI_01-1030 [Coccomyxa sp. Obi]|nr:hypothetical protein COCOBI_01-1030 [Coccomyxa sp. Obi]